MVSILYVVVGGGVSKGGFRGLEIGASLASKRLPIISLDLNAAY